MRETILKAVVCAVLVAAAGWVAGNGTHLFAAAGAPAAANGPVEVKIDNYSFMPGDLTVAAGTTVTWVNHDGVAHGEEQRRHDQVEGARYGRQVFDDVR